MEASTSKVVAEKKKEEAKKKNSALDALIDLLPELNFPGYQFMGPGTKVMERLARGERGINPLDNMCLEHDLVYSDKNGDRRKADRTLAEKAFSRMLENDTPGDERTLAMLTACCMIGKITFERFFSRITKAVTKGKRAKTKNNNNKRKNGVKKAA